MKSIILALIIGISGSFIRGEGSINQSPKLISNELRKFIFSNIFVRDLLEARQEVKLFEYGSEVKLGSFNATGDKALSVHNYENYEKSYGYDAPTVKIWDLETDKVHTLKGHFSEVHSATFNPTGDKVITSSWYETKIWDVETGKDLHTLMGHTDTVLSAIFNPTGDKVITSSLYETKVWDAETGALLNTFEGTFETLSPTQDKIVTVACGTARIWEIKTDTLLHILPIGNDYDHFKAVFNQAGDKLITSFRDETKIWDVETGAPLNTFEGIFKTLSPTQDKIVTVACKTVRIWEIKTGTRLHTLPIDRVWWDYSTIKAMFNQAGDKLITSFRDETKIWDVETGTLLHTLRHIDHIDRVSLDSATIEAMFNQAGDKLITSFIDETNIWDVETGTLLNTLRGRFEGFGPGNRIVTRRLDAYLIWDIETGIHLDGGDKLSIDALQLIGDDVLTETNSRNFEKETRWYWYREPLLEIEKFLSSEITPQQANILDTIFKALSSEGTIFDFNQYPHLWEQYVGLPELIKKSFDPYIDKLTA